MEVPMLGASQAKVREDIRKHADGTEVIEAVTAFVIFITADGRHIMTPDLDAPITTERPPTKHDVIGACANVVSDTQRQMQVEQTTMNVLGNLSRMQSDPQYHMMLEHARAEAAAAAAAAATRNGG